MSKVNKSTKVNVSVGDAVTFKTNEDVDRGGGYTYNLVAGRVVYIEGDSACVSVKGRLSVVYLKDLDLI
jgi:hypothetical protein